MRARYKERKGELFAKNSSLAIEIHEDTKHDLKFYVYNRRTHSILSDYKIPLLDHCKNSWQNVEPIKRPKKKFIKTGTVIKEK